jgi:hypothetical protein
MFAIIGHKWIKRFKVSHFFLECYAMFNVEIFSVGMSRSAQSFAKNVQVRTWNSVFGPDVVDDIKEEDDKPRNADFYLFYRPLESTPGLGAQPFAHWAVVVEYPNEPKRVFTFEAGKGEGQDNRIIATRSQQYPEERDKGKLVKLGTKFISPKRLLEYARSVSLNGQTYNLLIRNCQAWCKEFCGYISPSFLEQQFWDTKNTLTVGGAILGGLLAVVGGIFAMSSLASSAGSPEEDVESDEDDDN